jgi:chromosome segregation ATPase
MQAVAQKQPSKPAVVVAAKAKLPVVAAKAKPPAQKVVPNTTAAAPPQKAKPVAAAAAPSVALKPAAGPPAGTAAPPSVIVANAPTKRKITLKELTDMYRAKHEAKIAEATARVAISKQNRIQWQLDIVQRRYDQLHQRANILQAQLDSGVVAGNDLIRVQKELNDTKEATARARGRATELEAEVAGLQRRVTDLDQQRAALAASVSQRDSQITALQTQIQTNKTVADTQIAQLHAQIALKNQEIADKAASLGVASAEVAQLRTDVANLNTRIINITAAHTAATTKLQTDLNALTLNVINLTSAKQKAEKERDAALAQAAAAEAEADAALNAQGDMVKRLKEAKSDFNALQEDLAEADAAYRDMEAQRDALKAESDSLRSQLQPLLAAESGAKIIAKRVEKAEEDLAAANTKLDKAENDRRTLTEKITAQQKVIENLQDFIGTITDSLGEAQNAKAAAQTRVLELEGQLAGLTEENAAQQATIDSQAQAIAHLNQRYAEQSEANAAAINSLELTLIQQKSLAKAQVEDLQSQLTHAQEALASAKAADRARLEAEIMQLATEIGEINARNAEKINAIEKRHREELQQIRDRSAAQQQLYQNQIGKLRADLNTSNAQREQLTQQLARAQAVYEQQVTAINTLNGELTRQKELNQRYQAQLQESVLAAQLANKRAEDAMRQLARVRADTQLAQRLLTEERDEYRAQMGEVVLQKSALEGEKTQLKRQLRDSETERTKIRDDRDKLRTKLQKEKNANDALRTNLQDLRHCLTDSLMSVQNQVGDMTADGDPIKKAIKTALETQNARYNDLIRGCIKRSNRAEAQIE